VQKGEKRRGKIIADSAWVGKREGMRLKADTPLKKGGPNMEALPASKGGELNGRRIEGE